MDENVVEEQRDTEPSRTMDVTPLTNLDEGVYWTLDESANHVVLYDAITGRMLTNVVGAAMDYRIFPEASLDDDETASIMSLVITFSPNLEDPNAKLFRFSGNVLHLEYVEDDENSCESGGGGGTGDEESEPEEEGEETEESGGEGEGDAEGEGQGEEAGEGEAGGEGEGDEEGEGEGDEGSASGSPTGVTEEEYTPRGEHGGGGGNVDHTTEGKVKIGRRRMAWEAKN